MGRSQGGKVVPVMFKKQRYKHISDGLISIIPACSKHEGWLAQNSVSLLWDGQWPRVFRIRLGK